MGNRGVSLWWATPRPVAQYMTLGCMALGGVMLGRRQTLRRRRAARHLRCMRSVRIPARRITSGYPPRDGASIALRVERQVRNLLWKGKSQEAFYRGIDWHGWKKITLS